MTEDNSPSMGFPYAGTKSNRPQHRESASACHKGEMTILAGRNQLVKGGRAENLPVHHGKSPRGIGW
jgi:hypothetical protein